MDESEKLTILSELRQLEKQGYHTSQCVNMNTDLKVLRFELQLIRIKIARQQQDERYCQMICTTLIKGFEVFGRMYLDNMNKDKDDNVDIDAQCTETKEESKVCDICMRYEKNVAFVPCGHTCCSECIKHLNNLCHMCRNKIQKKIRIFI